MANPRGMKTWRRTSMAPHATDADIERQDKAYLAWLAAERGWFVEEKPCADCKGTGKRQSYERKRTRYHYVNRDCSYCGGTGKIAVDDLLPDLTMAERYVRYQHDELAQKAERAVDGIKHRLFWHGYRQVVTGSQEFAGATETEYQCREDLRDHISAAHTAAWEAASEARIAANDGASEPGFYDSLHEYLAPVREAEQRASELNRALWQLGTVHRDCWAIPGTDAVIYVGTRNQRHGYGHIEAAHSIVIKPGRAPSEYELDLIVAEAIEAVAPVELPMAA